jgi:hypothetical protein
MVVQGNSFESVGIYGSALVVYARHLILSCLKKSGQTVGLVNHQSVNQSGNLLINQSDNQSDNLLSEFSVPLVQSAGVQDNL